MLWARLTRECNAVFLEVIRKEPRINCTHGGHEDCVSESLERSICWVRWKAAVSVLEGDNQLRRVAVEVLADG